MNAEFRRVKEIFLAAVENPDPAERDVYLHEACGQDEELRRQVDALLGKHAQAGSFLESPAARPVVTVDASHTEIPGTVIGPYKLLQQIGEGGMGTVFMAEQTQPVHRKVALKVIKPGMDSRQVIARFEAERQALAMMDHVNIARVFDGGATENGRPYFVMELVHGVPITKYCDDNHLTPHERLELFVPVCQAIQHAHQKGIIHRDIKPSNVMITLYDGKPVPKVIDFGVAKATEQKLTERTLFTQYGTMIGTLEYMSPEQAEMSALGVDTRSDIYSLGVLLYELLTGSTPLTHKRMKEAAYAEILRMIKEEEPPRPSTRLSDSGEALASISANRHTEPARLTKLVRGELDWIVMKTLEKDRNRRYETANGFAADLQRYLHDETVQACPPSAWYKFRKLARRNKAVLGTGLLVAATLMIAVVTLAISNAWVSQERDQKDEALKDRQAALNEAKLNEETANQQRLKAQHNLKEALRVVDQMLTRVAEEKLVHVPQMEEVRRTLLLDALKFYEQFLKDNSTDPALRLEAGRAYRRVGYIQIHLGKPVEAEKGCRQAINLLEKLLGEFPSEPSYREALAESYNLLGFVFVPLGRYEESEAAHRRALALVEQLAAEEPQNEERRHQKLAIQLTLAGRASQFGRHREAEEFLRQSLAVQEGLASKLGGDRSRQFLPHHHLELAWVFRRTSRPLEAEQAFRQAITMQKELVDKFPARPDFRNDLAFMNHYLGDLLRETGRAQEVQEFYREAINLGTKLADEFPLVPSYHSAVAGHHLGVGLVLAANSRNQEAEQAYRQARVLAQKAIEMAPGQPGPWHELIEIHLCMGGFLQATARNDEAENSYRAAVELSRKLVADFPSQPDCRQRLARGHDSLGLLLKDLRRHGAAEQQYREALAVRKKLVDSLPSSGTYRSELADSYSQLGLFFKDRQRPQEAETAFRQVVQLREKLIADFPKEAEYSAQLAHWYVELAGLLKATSPVESAQSYRKAIAIQEKLTSASEAKNWNEKLLALDLELGNLLLAAGQPREAETAFRRAVDLAKQLPRQFPGAEGTVAERLDRLAECYAGAGRALKAAGRTDEAKAAFQEALGIYQKLAEGDTWNGHRWHSVAVIQYQKGDWKACVVAMEKAIEVFPSTSSWQWFYLAIAEGRLGEKERARRWYEQAVRWMRNHPTNEELLPLRAEAASLLGLPEPPPEGRPRAALDHREIYTLILEAHPDAAWAYGKRGYFQARAKQWDEALADYAKAIEVQERFPPKLPETPIYYHGWGAEWQFELGRLLRTLDRSEEAKKAFGRALANLSKAIEMKPKYWQAWASRGVAYAELGLWDKAGADIAKACELNVDEWHLRYQIALVRLAQHDTEGYRKVCSDMVERSPGFAYFWTAWTCVLAPDALSPWGPFIPLAEKVFYAPKYDRLSCSGAVLYRAGRFEEAAQRLAEAEAAFKDTPIPVTTIVYTWLFQAMTQHRLGHADRAKERLAKAAAAIDGRPPPEQREDRFTTYWTRRLTLQLLRREAEALIRP